MSELPIDPNQLAALLGISLEEATKLVKAADEEMRRRADAVLATNPEIARVSDAERAAIQGMAEKLGIPFEQLLEQRIRDRAFAADMFAELRRNGPKISPKDVAECFDGELPNGWDDMIPKELLDENRDA